jgi:ribosomal protein L7Ae-like RNA K-turn-binding protein
MKLLREGDGSKRSVNDGGSRNGGLVPYQLEKPPSINGVRYPGLASLRNSQPLPTSQKVDKDIASTSLTSATLGQLWTDALATPKKNMLPATVERDQPQQLFMDDTLVERLTLDRDVSDLDYWSDDGQICLTTSRMHRTAPPFRHKLPQCPHERKVRSYVMQELSADLDHAAALLLDRINHFHRWHESMKDVGKRRYTIGLKEVTRRLKQNQIVGLVIAPDIDGSTDHGGLDDRMREVLGFAYQHEIPVMFALSRHRIGRAIGKTLNISILGITDVTGARTLFDQATAMASAQRAAWLQKHAA